MCKLPPQQREKPTALVLFTGTHLWRQRSKQPSHTAHAGGFFSPFWRTMRRPMTPDLQARKRALRAELVAARARLTPAERAERSEAIAARLERHPPFHAATTVALYAPLGAEVDAGPVLRAAQARGVRVLFPRAVAGERRLDFCACRPGELVRGPLGAGEPPPGAAAVPLPEIQCFVVPGVGFSRDGLRLGRGGGYYDATLALAPGALRVGVAFELQLCPELPREPHDVPLDAVVTERDTLLFSRQVT
jgi:5-formyltetrahydrofolate cyclo-ligase